jgi:mRNA interferase MazF
MVIEQGNVFWADLPPPSGSGPGFRHPVVVVQSDIFNESRIATTIVCLLTSNVALASAPGNVLVAKGEANLRRRSVVNVTQIYTLDKTVLQSKIGTLSKRRVAEVLQGVLLVMSPG